MSVYAAILIGSLALYFYSAAFKTGRRDTSLLMFFDQGIVTHKSLLPPAAFFLYFTGKTVSYAHP